ncbi:hypothetical protein BpHYR1_039045 [Brachionus plicatilis]|uniref:Uncharacterized protein n=1 Tax=Brachionus plicatilis TaxID=10195 RepID=A0A3M7R4L7_BRAPC|nr:hypothetical protein BpHYR1_039045 [Brachionus plicatilis]
MTNYQEMRKFTRILEKSTGRHLSAIDLTTVLNKYNSNTNFYCHIRYTILKRIKQSMADSSTRIYGPYAHLIYFLT